MMLAVSSFAGDACAGTAGDAGRVCSEKSETSQKHLEKKQERHAKKTLQNKNET